MNNNNGVFIVGSVFYLFKKVKKQAFTFEMLAL